MSSAFAPLHPLADPLALGRLQVLLIPVHHPDSHVGASVVAVDDNTPVPPPLTEELYEGWRGLFRRVQMLRGDEIQFGPPSTGGHRRGSPSSDSSRTRFHPVSSGGSISRAANANHVHLAYPSQPPAKHLYPLSLLRMSAFPLVVIGIAVDDTPVEGYAVGSKSPKASAQATSNEVWSQAFSQSLSALLPPTAAFPLVKRLVLVPQNPLTLGSALRSPVTGTAPKLGSPTGDGVVCRAPLDGAEGWVQRLLGDVVGQVFGELGELAASLESPNGLKTLSGTLLPFLSATLPGVSPAASPAPLGVDPLRIQTGSPAARTPGLVHSNSLPAVPSATMGVQVTRALTPGGRPTSVQAPSAPPIQSNSIAQVSTPSLSSNPFRRSAALIGRSTSGTGPSPGIASSLLNSGIAKYTSAPLTGIAGGRLLKLLGDMYLITGMYSDAIKCYDEGAERCRTVGDVLWEALAREGRAVAGVGEAWEARDGSTLSTPFNISPIPVEILTHYLSSLACLCRAPLPFPPVILAPAPQAAGQNAPPISTSSVSAPSPTSVGSGEGLLAHLYASLCLRISHFVLLIFAAGGWGSIALSSLITHTLPRSFPPLDDENFDSAQNRKRRIQLNQLAIQSQLTRSAVLGHAEAALGPYRRAMTKAEQLSVLVEVVWIARWLDMERKEASITRQVVKLLANLISEGREESLRLTSKTESAISTTFGSANQGVAIHRREMTGGNRSVLALVDQICAAFGIKLVDFGGKRSTTITQGAKEVADPRFGWPEMQVEVVKEAIAVAEALPDHPGVVRLCVSALNNLYGYLSAANQNYLAKLYPQSMNTIRRRAIEFDGIPWWLPGRVVLSVEVASLPPSRLPIERSRVELTGSTEQGRKDPFLYNPRVKAPEVGKTVLVANEQVDVFVTLQNVFAFDLEIQDLSLLTSGAPFITSPLPLILPASSVQTVRVTGHAPNAGSLQIRGVNVRLMDGSSAEFLLPVIDSAEQKRDSKHRSRQQAEVMKTKRQGLEARQSVILSETIPDNHRWLECTVVEEQPLLWIKKTTLSHGTIMLYNGETSTIRITLENTSKVPVDFIKLSFEDSISREAHHILAEGEVSPEKAYELDHESVQRPVFQWDNNTDLSIPAGGRATINVQCLGKVGCTDALIRIDYGYVNRTTDTFHTRQLTFPILFTVYHTLECYGLDVVSLRSDSANLLSVPNSNGDGTGKEDRPTSDKATNSNLVSGSQFAKSVEDELRAVLHSGEGKVLFCVNVRNVFSTPFEVALNAIDDSGTGVTRLVPPGATERLVLPLPRQALPLEERTRPIPLPSGRQFTVDKTKKSPAEVARTRELFWTRDKLFSLVAVTWRDPNSLRSGNLSLADQHLSPAQLDSFRLDELRVELAVKGREEALHPTDFIDLHITVCNNLERPVKPYVRLEALPTSSVGSSWSMPAPAPAPRRISSLPAAPTPVPKTVAFDGVLCTTLPTMAPGERATHSVGAVLLASGTYSFRAAAEDVTNASLQQPPTICFSPSVTVAVR